MHLSGAASKWSPSGRASLWLYTAQTPSYISRMTACPSAQKLQGPISVTGPSPANGSHCH